MSESFYWSFGGVNEASVVLCRKLLEYGVRREMHGFQASTSSACYEFPGPVVIEITDPTARQILIPERKWNKILPMAESLWMVLGSSDLDDLPGHFVKNIYNFSDDGHTWRGCFTGDTRIKLLDGSSPRIKDLVGKDHFWVYSKDNKGRVVPGLGHSAKVTKKVTELVEITLDSGDIIRCTDNHPFMLLDRTYRNAEDLKEGDSLSPLYLRNSKTYGYTEEYLDVKDDSGEWIPVHRRVGEFITNKVDKKDKPQLHHIDMNKRNNSPENLVWLSNKEHRQVHSEKARKIIMDRYNSDEEFKNMMDSKSKENFKKATEKQLEHLNLNDEIGQKLRTVRSRNMKNIQKIPGIQEKMIAGRIFKVVDKLVSKGLPFNEENYNKLRNPRTGVPTYKNILKYFSSYEDMLKAREERVNHKIVSVRRISVPETEVYDITVDDYNNFALDSGVFVHNSYGPRIRGYTGISNQYYRSLNNPKIRSMEDHAKESFVMIDQLQYVVETLKNEPTSRQALITIHDPAKDSQLGLKTKDIPCTRSLHFMIVDGKLNLYVWLRSNDILWGAQAVNWYNFTFMQQYVAKILGVPLGSYFHIVDNLHYYENSLDTIRTLSLVSLDEARRFDESLHNDYNEPINSLQDFDYTAMMIYRLEEEFWAMNSPYVQKGLFSVLEEIKNRLSDPFLKGWAYAFPLAMKNIQKEVKEWLIENGESENKMIAQFF